MDDILAPVDVGAIRRSVRGEIGSHLIYFPRTGSTNAELLALPPAQLRHGLVAIADHQTAGRGRLSRNWVAPPCTSLLLSVVLSWPAELPVAQSVMLAALAVGDTLSGHLGLEPMLKWPNDVLIDGRKVCGILGETARIPAASAVVLGIGLNVNFDPAEVEGIPENATTIRCVLGREVAREPLFAALVDHLELWYRVCTGDRDALFAAWSLRLDLLGRRISIRDESGTWSGTASCVHPDGGLRVRADDGQEQTVYAADVSLHTGGFR